MLWTTNSHVLLKSVIYRFFKVEKIFGKWLLFVSYTGVVVLYYVQCNICVTIWNFLQWSTCILGLFEASSFYRFQINVAPLIVIYCNVCLFSIFTIPVHYFMTTPWLGEQTLVDFPRVMKLMLYYLCIAYGHDWIPVSLIFMFQYCSISVCFEQITYWTLCLDVYKQITEWCCHINNMDVSEFRVTFWFYLWCENTCSWMKTDIKNPNSQIRNCFYISFINKTSSSSSSKALILPAGAGFLKCIVIDQKGTHPLKL